MRPTEVALMLTALILVLPPCCQGLQWINLTIAWQGKNFIHSLNLVVKNFAYYISVVVHVYSTADSHARRNLNLLNIQLFEISMLNLGKGEKE